MKSSPVPTLQTIADLAGVSRATVSLAMRNQPNLPAVTRERIQKIADEVGYRPNPLVSTLMTHIRAARPLAEQGTIAFITNYSTREEWRNYRTFERFFNGAAERANRNGYHLEDFWMKEPRMTARKMTKILAARGIRGAVIAPLEGKGGHLSLDVSELATVTFGLSMKRPKLHRVDNHQIESFRTALREMKRRGYRRIGMAIEKNHDRHVNYNWSIGYLEYLHRGDLACPRPIYDPEVPSKATLLAWLTEFRPDAILSVNTSLLGWLREIVDIPEEVGFALLDRLDTDHGIAGIDGLPELTGAAAIDLLIGQIHRNERGVPAAPKLTLTEGVWVDGHTVRAGVQRRTGG